MSGMVKLIYSAAFDPAADVSMRIVEDPAILTKSASTVFGCDYSNLAPDKDHVGIHLTAVGAWERYGSNRNGDSFPKKACLQYHDTFVKHGSVFRHHRNKDRTKNLGLIKASTYNGPMDRIELFVHANKERAAPELARLEKEGEIPFSMACVRAGTLIVTDSVVKPIEAIQPGDNVLTHTGKWGVVGNRSVRDVTEYVIVNTVSWGRTAIEITGNHPFLAASFDDIDRGMRADHVDHPDKGWKRRHRAVLHKHLKWTPAAELTPYHYLAVPIDRYIDPDKAVCNPPAWARLLGYYIAEGSLGNGMTCFTCHVDDACVEEVSELAPWTSVTIRPRDNSSCAVDVQCFGTELCQMIEGLCGRRGENKHIPELVRHADAESKFNFIAAWFNGDGWQDKNGMHWSIHYQGLAVDLQRLLAALDIPSSCTRIDHPTDRGVVVSDNAVEYVVSVSNQYSELFSGISKAEELPVEGTSKCRTFISGDYLLVPVKSVLTVKVDEPVPVYNFSVVGDESYTVHGLAVHNCKVAFDRCNRCNTIRKNGQDPNQCDHIKYELGKMADDGTVTCTHNDEPDFFDISFVGRPADRIAWQLKVASGEVMDSVKLAEAEGLWVPDHIAIASASGLAKLAHLKQIAAFQDLYRGWFTKSAGVRTPADRYFYELRKAAGADIGDDTIQALRCAEPADAFRAMARAGVILTVPQFFKYATGPQYGEMEAAVPAIAAAVADAISNAVKAGECQQLCNDCAFDVAVDDRARALPAPVQVKLAEASVLGHERDARIIGATLDGKITKIAVDSSDRILFNRCEIVVLAEKYAAYQLSAVDAIIGYHPDTDADSVMAVAAAQNLFA